MIDLDPLFQLAAHVTRYWWGQPLWFAAAQAFGAAALLLGWRATR